MKLASIACGLAALLALTTPVTGEEAKKTQPAAAAVTTEVFGDGEYQVGPSDLLEVFVWKEPDLTATVVVRPDGKISLPLINEIDANGKTAAELQQEISTKLKRYLATPVVNVILKEINSPKISVLGNVKKPDQYKIQQRVTVLDAIALAGGFTDFAKRDRVYVIRNTGSGVQKIRVNVKDFLGDRDQPVVYLQKHDTVYVE